MASFEEVGEGLIPKFTDWMSARDALRDIREEGSRESHKVAVLGKQLVEKYASKLGDEGVYMCTCNYVHVHVILACIHFSLRFGNQHNGPTHVCLGAVHRGLQAHQSFL